MKCNAFAKGVQIYIFKSPYSLYPVSPRTAQEGFVDLFKLARWTMGAVNAHWRGLYRHGIWIPREQASRLLDAAWAMLDTWHDFFQGIVSSTVGHEIDSRFICPKGSGVYLG